MNSTLKSPGTSGSGNSRALPMDSRQPLLIGITSMLGALVVIFMFIRLYIRGYVMKKWGLDDSFFIWSCVSTPDHFKPLLVCDRVRNIWQFVLLGQGACYLAKPLAVALLTISIDAIDGGLGLHIWATTISSMQRGVRYTMASAFLYQIAFASIKATFLLQYRRAFALPHLQRFCDIILAVVILLLVGSMIYTGIILKSYMKFGLQFPNKEPYIIFTYVTASMNLVTDIVIFLLPLPLIGRLRLATMQKFGLICSFGVGIFTGAISVLRIIRIPATFENYDSFYNSVPILLLTMAEPTSAVICACVPLMRPLLSCPSISSFGSRKAISKSTDYSTGPRGITPKLPPYSPATPKTPNLALIRRSVHEDIEGHAMSEQAGNPPVSDVYSPTKTQSRSDDHV
ncbi:hypothetical protein CCHL11_03711 [Colletotrichum chlorophyti]|uniref:Rhodopsin domain-containing protein n=1 Tax=Colletotrichum chlorophyti TaxID=708187 RepID=A0A1Q8RS79_9PEZI|nr:hypothetical protein CCHL11_03711 [Colletotrichum chlorophyti]